MPKKRNYAKSFKPSSLAVRSAASAPDKPQRSVNELLANLRATSAGPSAAHALQAAATTPSVPPAIREILQLPETPAPAPRRHPRQRFDASGRRLPAGPPPPRSWTSRRDACTDAASRVASLRQAGSTAGQLPGVYSPDPGSLIDLTIRSLAADWDIHRDYNKYHIYYMPAHLKAHLIRYINMSDFGPLSISELETILIPPPDDEEEPEQGHYHDASNDVIGYLDLSGAVGQSLKLKEVTDLLFPAKQQAIPIDAPSEDWDEVDVSPSPPRALLPNLTHLSLALSPDCASQASWKQLLTLSSKLSTVTHLSLAFWPEPCYTPRSRNLTVTSPQGQRVPYGGTNMYSHSIDQDWSEALLVLRHLSKNLYKLEFLDLTGCASWFRALMERLEHDYIDWAGAWGKISLLRLYSGQVLDPEPLLSQKIARAEAATIAANVERHIRSTRAGKGRFITVERDEIEY
ncbi:hypothetical protein B0I35DRAFT_416928 [Stachybotrys elegans]|uniref:Tafazzin n=1 Tax=Stachybotrys elegans TaxID=80388 RepID=A0A8K0WX90_9HYPO|nr:hypothetical protein B0I35DRAFT_416928 [Stachybotrys elegans]